MEIRMDDLRRYNKPSLRQPGFSRWRRAATILALLATLLLVVEGGSYLVLKLLMLRSRTVQRHEAKLQYYQDVPWGAAYWREHARFLENWFETYPFGLWRGRPFEGEFTNNNERGERRTTYSNCEGDAPIIYVYGGSTVWGQGSPDQLTIPSDLAKRFSDDGKVVCVVNRGSDMWSSNEHVVDLLQELKRADGRQPNFAIFLDSCNDVLTPFLLRRGIEPPPTPLNKGWLDALAVMHLGSFQYLTGTNTWTLASTLINRIKGRDSFPVPAEPERLGRAVIDRYFQNVKAVAALSNGFGFGYEFFWLPIVAGPHDPPATHAAVEVTRPLVHAAKVDHFHDLTGSYDDRLAIDICHITPEANRIVSQIVYDTIKGNVPAKMKQ